ncbi:MAG: putative multidrug resistance ABC transporter ATP-binding/permease protein YheI [Acidobacteria bacterium]|nr:putative multidrug resistance ABC transporter ATP-binding/permease protein YheI [Acidobacteriota bacterium]
MSDQNKSASAYATTSEPASDFASGRAWLIFYLKKYRWRLVAGTFFVLVSVTLGVFTPRYTGAAIDYLTSSGATGGGLMKFVALIVGAQILSGVFLFLQRRTLINMSRYIEYDLRQDFYGHLQKLPLQFFQQRRTGDLMARATNDLSAVRQIVGPAIMYSEQTLFRVLIILPLMFQISVKLTLIMLLTMPLVTLTVKYFGHQIHVRFEKIQEFFSEITARAQENLTGVRVVRAFAQEEAEKKEFARLNQQYVDRNLNLVKLSAVFRPLMQFFIGLGFAAILLIGGYETARGRMTIGEFTAFNLYLEQLIWPLIAMGFVTNLVQRGTASLKRMSEIMRIEPAIADAAKLRAGEWESVGAGELRGKIEFRDLTFRYAPESPPILRDINLVIEPGQTVAFIGRTGAGKSTLMNLIPRLLDAEPGMVLIDDKPIREIPLKPLRENIGYVPQETFLFSETLAENIAFGIHNGRSDLEKKIEQAADVAGLADDVNEFQHKYQTILGERGITLSGGQKQRAAIARAIIREPKIMILDDSLSAVDTYTEEKILSRLRGVMRSRTTLIVAHRISTVKDADLICVLDHGRIVEQGSHEELMRIGGAYADLYERQLLEEELAAS